MVIENICKNCRHFFDSKDGYDQGECRRFPPRIELVTYNVENGPVQEYITVYVKYIYFCGEHVGI